MNKMDSMWRASQSKALSRVLNSIENFRGLTVMQIRVMASQLGSLDEHGNSGASHCFLMVSRFD